VTKEPFGTTDTTRQSNMED